MTKKNRIAQSKAKDPYHKKDKKAIIFKQMPREFQVCLRELYSSTVTAGGTYNQLRIGLLEPLGRTPTFMTQLFNIYKLAKVIRVDLEVNVVNATTAGSVVPLQVVTAAVPFSDSTGYTDITVPSELPSAQLKILSATGGMDRLKLRQSYMVDNLVGEMGGPKWWFTQAQSASSTPLAQEEPVFIVGIQPLVLTTWTAHVQCIVRYHVEFFGLEAVN
jgi:hypothetical protein